MRLRKSKREIILRPLVLIAIVALIILANHVQSQWEPRRIRIAEISPLMNFSVVRIEGRLDASPIYLQNGSVMYRINDGSGTLPVFADPPQTEALPVAGSRVSVVGNLSVGAGNNIRLRAQVGERVVFIEGPAMRSYNSEYKLGELTLDQEGNQVTVAGRVLKVWKQVEGSRAPCRIVLADQSGSLNVVHWFNEPLEIGPGDEVEVTGTVSVYAGRLQLKLWRASDVRPYLMTDDVL